MYLRLNDIHDSENDGGILIDNQNGNLYVALVKARIPFLFYNVEEDMEVKSAVDGKTAFVVKKGSYGTHELIDASKGLLRYDSIKGMYNLNDFIWYEESGVLHSILGGKNGVVDFVGAKSKFSFLLGELDGSENLVDYRNSSELYCYNVVGDIFYGSVLDVEPKHLVYKKLSRGIFRLFDLKVVDGDGVMIVSKHPIEIELHFKIF